jgi:hypothetical protein
MVEINPAAADAATAAGPHSRRRRGGLSIVGAGEELLEDLSRSGL